MERNVALADYPPVCLKADCLPNRANAELKRQPDDVQPVADNEKLDVSSLVAMMALTTLQREFKSVSGPDHAQVIRRWVLAETDVEAVDEALTWFWLGRTMKSDGAWWVGTVRGTLLRDQVLSRQVKLDFIWSEFPVNAVFRTSLSSQ